MTSNQTPSVLDNPVWHSLSTNHIHFAVGSHRAMRYAADVAPFVGIPELSAVSLHDLMGIVAKGEVVAIGGAELPPGTTDWVGQHSFPVVQMVSEQPPQEIETTETLIDLGAEDVPDMLDLIALTQPGPFLPRTVELGHYLGIRKEGRLVAMAGERLYPPGYHEISAVCTHPDYQGQGYAQLLVSRLSVENWQRGDIPFLHVAPGNSRARKVYERLHFRDRGEFPLLVISY